MRTKITELAKQEQWKPPVPGISDCSFDLVLMYTTRLTIWLLLCSLFHKEIITVLVISSYFTLDRLETIFYFTVQRLRTLFSDRLLLSLLEMQNSQQFQERKKEQ
ncbi:urea transporter 2 [Platysternon megacephalum]|uniref:Urea transporter 2 n=1 Tax=Platysternon megacephalum TaxID=55544 RepID=A0A4D9ERG4_9SAUR|nr:urea transporter 2 [Platysternon megacephalum]